MRDRLVEWTGLPEAASVDDVVVAVHDRLARAPSMVVTATLDDALRVKERPNLPGTTTERANWSLALPDPLEDWVDDPVVGQIVEALHRPGD
jgi:4-alpha-glucanotransferase